VNHTPASSSHQRRFPIGAEPLADGGVHFRVWAPGHDAVEVVENDGRGAQSQLLQKEPGGYHSGVARFLASGSSYGFRLDGEARLYPDPASRFQPSGPLGPSAVVDPTRYHWHDAGFAGLGRNGLVLYELHLGTFTKEGTYAAAAAELPALRELGVNAIELMPVADFVGRFGWGYDGVDLWAPTRLYGEPDELRALVDAAHQQGIGVVLDVVYNHLGPSGNFLKQYAAAYFSDRYKNEWGEPLNFDGPGSEAVREFFVQNARYWIEEFHFDGLRLDATQSIFDASERHLVAEVVSAVRAAGRALGKSVYVVAENEPQEAQLVRSPEQGGYGGDALWNDDFHHTARVALTGRHEAYYSDYRGTPQELISALKWGYLYQGQHYAWQKARRGKPALDLEATQYVTYLQNHDQIANSLTGERMDRLTSPAQARAMTALFLLAPPNPMLFQGQEFAASAPFLYFADHEPELAKIVDRERRKFISQFPSVASAGDECFSEPSDPRTFERCKLDFSERTKHAGVYALHHDLLKLRRQRRAFAQQRADQMHGAVLSDSAFALRFFCSDGDALLLVNLGPDLDLSPQPEPLLAPAESGDFRLIWSSEDPRYGGRGTGQPYVDGSFRLPAHSTLVFASPTPLHSPAGITP
jgi:maltooligosyltrehalose trehalohydrolase